MRILISHAYNIKGGVESTACSLIREFTKLTEQVILALPEKQIAYFQNILPSSGKLIYEPLAWPNGLLSRIKKRLFPNRLRYLARKYGATHCLYMMINGQHVPDLNIPTAGILHDVYWHALPGMADDLVKARDNDLNEWLSKSALVFTNSENSKRDALKLFPKGRDKIRVVPWAADIPLSTGHPDKRPDSNSAERIFYYPSAHSSYQKNHLALFKAAVRLAEQGLKFKIIISGVDTESLAGGKPLKDTRVEPARLFYDQNKGSLSGHAELLGDCRPGKTEELYNSCSCVILPSTYEGFGLPLSEAISRGIPVICSNLDVFKEQVALYRCEDLVQFFPVNDIEALAKCMEGFINCPRKRLSLEQVRRRFSHWTWTDVTKKYVGELESIAQRA